MYLYLCLSLPLSLSFPLSSLLSLSLSVSVSVCLSVFLSFKAMAGPSALHYFQETLPARLAILIQPVPSGDPSPPHSRPAAVVGPGGWHAHVGREMGREKDPGAFCDICCARLFSYPRVSTLYEWVLKENRDNGFAIGCHEEGDSSTP
uniref:Uncharacterized protein n=1 Tax=Micrurus surinamensis TaxID=129470 RepID=A0A2D4NSP9_MICSU